MKPSEHKAQIMATLIAGMLANSRIDPGDPSVTAMAELYYNFIQSCCQTLPSAEPERKGITVREITDWFDKQKSLHGYIVVQDFLRAHNLLIEDSDAQA